MKIRTFMVDPIEMNGLTKPFKDSKAVILDLRDNGGGELPTMLNLLGQFGGEAFEMAQAISRKKSESIRVKPVAPHLTCPLFVLVDSASASASEMLARSVQIHRRGIVIGDRSAGSVNVARFFWHTSGPDEDVEFGTEIAVSKVIMEDGQALENMGVIPDEFCVPTQADLRSGKDPCLDRALTMARTAVDQHKN